MAEAVFAVNFEATPPRLLEAGYPLLLAGIASQVLATFLKGAMESMTAQDIVQKENVAQLLALSTALQVCSSEAAQNLLNVTDLDTGESLELVRKHFKEFFQDKLRVCESIEAAQELWDEMQESFKLAIAYWSDYTVTSRPGWMPDIRRPLDVLVMEGSDEIH